MRLRIAAALALIVSSSVFAQTIPDLSTAVPAPGEWSYSTTADGSEARFGLATGSPRLVLHCTRATRRVSVATPANPGTTLTNIWTSSQTRNVSSTFNPATGRLSFELQAYDGLLDAIAMSRGRIGMSVGAQSPLVVPPWPEIARVVEDCRA